MDGKDRSMTAGNESQETLFPRKLTSAEVANMWADMAGRLPDAGRAFESFTDFAMFVVNESKEKSS